MILNKIENFRGFAKGVFEYSFYLTIFFLPISIGFLEIFKASFMISGVVLFLLNLPDLKKIKSKEFFSKIKNTLVIPALILFVALIFSFINTDYLKDTYKGVFLKWGRYILFYFIVIFAVKDNKKEKIKNILITLIFSAAVLIADSFIQLVCGIDPIRNNYLFKSSRVNATFGINNNFAGWLIALLPVFLAVLFFLKSLKFKEKFGYFAISFFLFVLMALTYARTAWLGFFASMGILIFRKNRKLIVWLILFIIGFLLILPPKMKHDIFMANTAFARIDIWKGAWNMIKEHPITGLGINTFSSNYPKYRVISGQDYAHNCFVQMWAEAGIIGLFALVNLVLLFYISGGRFFRKKPFYDLIEIFSFGIFLGINATIIHSFFDTNLYTLQLASFFWIMLGIYDGLRWGDIKSVK